MLVVLRGLGKASKALHRGKVEHAPDDRHAALVNVEGGGSCCTFWVYQAGCYGYVTA
jgi:hypothetical protein